MKQALGIITILLAFISYIPYLRDTFKGITKPHMVSWFLWMFVSFIAFGLQWSKGAGAGAYANFAMGLISLVLFIQGIKSGTKNIRPADVFSFILAVVAIILWLVVHQPTWSIILVVLIDIFSFIPTFIKSWHNPHQETLITWILSSVRQFLVILSLQSFNFVTALFPVYALTANILFCIELIYRRRTIR
ncbi:hypothetical protein KBC75_04110 [Candidatus Shapirobacteria bacterium]|nr:hypothetical protein [Candidatus Shapirobacteria bacterium]